MRQDGSTNFPRHWELQGHAGDGAAEAGWVTLKRHDGDATLCGPGHWGSWAVEGAAAHLPVRFLRLKLTGPTVRRCRLKPDETHVESAWFQRLKLNCNELLSNLAFNVNLRRYTTTTGLATGRGRQAGVGLQAGGGGLGGCGGGAASTAAASAAEAWRLCVCSVEFYGLLTAPPVHYQ